MKDFLSISFKGRISTPPVFDTTSNGLKRARLNVAVNAEYKTGGEASFLSVAYFGQEADYVERCYKSGKTFQVGCTIFVSDAKLTLKTVNVIDSTGKQRKAYEADSVTAKTDKTFCAEKYGQTAGNNGKGFIKNAPDTSWQQQPTFEQPFPYSQQATYSPFQQPFNYRPNYVNPSTRNGQWMQAQGRR